MKECHHGPANMETGQLPQTEQLLLSLPAHSVAVLFKVQSGVNKIFIRLHLFSGFSP